MICGCTLQPLSEVHFHSLFLFSLKSVFFSPLGKFDFEWASSGVIHKLVASDGLHFLCLSSQALKGRPVDKINCKCMLAYKATTLLSCSTFCCFSRRKKNPLHPLNFQLTPPPCLVAQSLFEKIKRSDVFRAGFMAIYSAADWFNLTVGNVDEG